MKKALLFTFAAGFAVSAVAQQVQPKPNVYQKVPLKSILQSENKAVYNPSKTKSSVNHTSKINPGTSTATCVNMGVSGNAYGTAFGAKTALYANNTLNTVALTRRSNLTIDPATGYYRVDYSTNGGTTFTVDAGPVYSDPANVYRGRYPQGVIYNPTGNTNPSNAYVTYFGPATDGTNWIGQVFGTGQISSLATSTQNQWDFVWNGGTNPNGLIPDAQVMTQQGVSWVVGIGYDPAIGDYTDTIMIHKGTFGTEFTYAPNTVRLPFPISVDNGGAKRIASTSVAFAPNGTTGYVTVQGHDDYAFEPDSVYYLIVKKTTDGGATWGSPIRIKLDQVEQALQTGQCSFTTAFEMDTEVDNNGNLHIVTAIGPGNPAVGGWSIGTGPNQWGIFDIFTSDGGTTWKYQLIDKPMAFRGDFAALTEDSRPQISTNWAHDKMAFVWFDTDTITNNSPPTPGNGNYAPDLYVRGLDVATMMWAPEMNATAGGCADALCSFGLVSPYCLSGASDITIPASYAQLTATDLDPVNHIYLKGITITNASMNSVGNGQSLSGTCAVGIQVPDNNIFTITSNYPNPFSGTTSFDINLVESATVSVEVVNVVGETVIPAVAKNYTSGNHTITINASSLASGVYFYTVTAGEYKATKRMVVK